MSEATCEVPGCDRPTREGRSQCYACRKQRTRTGSTVRTSPARAKRYRSAWARLQEAALVLAEADAEDDAAYARAQRTLRDATKAYMRSLGRREGGAREVSPQLEKLDS